MVNEYYNIITYMQVRKLSDGHLNFNLYMCLPSKKNIFLFVDEYKDPNQFDSTFVRDFNKKNNAFLKIGLSLLKKKK